MHSNINRRKFIKSTAAGSAALAFVPSMLYATGSAGPMNYQNQNRMKGITPISVIDNACLLAYSSGELSQASKNCIATDIQLRDTPGNKGRLAVLMPPGDEKIFELLRLVKSGSELKHKSEKRALLFGWAAVNAVEKNINLRLKDLNDKEFGEVRMHQDALVVKGLSKDQDLSGIRTDDLEALLNALLTRTITRTHTLKPDSDDGIGWVNRMAAWRKQNLVNMKALASAIIEPDVSKAGKSFYMDDDLIVKTATMLQNGALVSEKSVKIAIEETTLKSEYAKALRDATTGIIVLDQYLNGKAELNDYKIGV